MFKKIYEVLASDAPKSWNSHAFAVCFFGLGLGLLAAPLNIDALWLVSGGWCVGYVFYRMREWVDEFKYKRDGSWRRRRKGGVSPEVDGKGDILGPRWLAIAGGGLLALEYGC